MANTSDNWIEGLKSPDEEVRRMAVASLGERSGDSILAHIDDALGDASWRVRKAAVDAIRGFSDRSRAARTLIRALGDSDNAGRRTAAIEALIIMGRSATALLLEYLNDSDEDVRKFIIDILGEIKDPEAVPALLPITSDPAENIKLSSIEALGAIGGDHAFKALLALLPADDVSVQFGVLHALSQIGSPIPMDSIRPLLPKKILRRAIYDALGHTKSPEAIDLIVEGLTGSAKSAKQAAVRALDRLASQPELEAAVETAVKSHLAKEPLASFADLLETDHLKTKRAAIKLLSMVGTPEAVKILIRAANDDNVQAEVIEAVGRIKTMAPVAVEEMAREQELPAGHEVIRALKDIKKTAQSAMGPMTNDQFNRVRDLVSRESGLFYDHDLKYLVERRLQKRMESLSLADYDAYVDLLEKSAARDGQERTQLINSLSTNETYFFREDFQLRAFKDEILPTVVEEKKRSGSRRIRIWSAGCSSGEEPYTIAMILKESPGLDGFHIEIMGSDINGVMIDKARDAVYNRSSFRVTPQLYQKKYFTEGESRFKLSGEIRNMVQFDTVNLLSCESAGHLSCLDIIFCRNVIIYFSSEAKRQVVDNFYQLLNPDGYLLLGHSESLMSISNMFELVHLEHDLVYRKCQGSPAP